MYNSEIVRKKINKMLLINVFLHMVMILISIIARKNIASSVEGSYSFFMFIISGVLTEVIISGFLGITIFGVGRLGISVIEEIVVIVNVIVWIICMLIGVLIGMRVSKWYMTILAIIIALILSGVVLWLFTMWHTNIVNLQDVYAKTYVCDRFAEIFSQEVGQYNNMVNEYNHMNHDIETMGKIIGAKSGGEITIEKLPELEIPFWDECNIRIFQSRHATEYITAVNDYRIHVERIVKKTMKQKEYIKLEIEKKEKMLSETQRAAKRIDDNRLPEDFRKSAMEDVAYGYERLKEKSGLERKIKTIKRGKRNGYK